MEQGSTQPSFLQVVLYIAPILAAGLVWKRHHDVKAHQAFVLEHGCKPVQWMPGLGFMGLQFVSRAIKEAGEGHFLPFFLTIINDETNTFKASVLGSTGVDTIIPENVEVVLSSKFEDFTLGSRNNVFHPLLGNGIFTQDGAEWKHSRQLLRPQFMSNRLQNFKEIQESVESLLQSIPTDGLVDLQPLFYRLTLETTMFLLFGHHAHNLGNPIELESVFSPAFKQGQQYLVNRMRRGVFYFLYNDRKAREACKTCHDFVDKLVAAALGATNPQACPATHDDNGSYVFIDELVKQTHDPKVLRDQCMNILLAGRDTTAITLAWTFRLLARHQKVTERLRNEIRELLGLGPDAAQPTMDSLKKMPYLGLVLKEVLRLYPAVPLNGRYARKDIVFPAGGGPDRKSPFLLKAGQVLNYSAYAMHRRKDIFGDDADDFRPERWENDALKNIHKFAYVPFNAGPRVCLGQDFALLEAGYTVARMIQLYPYIELPPTEPNVKVGAEKHNLTLVLSCDEGCVVQLGSQARTPA